MNVLFISNHDTIPEEEIGFNHPLYQIEEFLKLGYNVTYIVPSFNHFNKTQRIHNENIYSVNEKFRSNRCTIPGFFISVFIFSFCLQVCD